MEGDRLAATEVDGLMLGDQWGTDDDKHLDYSNRPKVLPVFEPCPKWTLWHGDADKALRKLALIRDNLTDEKKRSKLKSLHDYLRNNRDYLVNYDEREKADKPFTSQVAESHIDTLINARHKRKQKMQWTREGAHNVLQIRALMTSNEWEEKWLDFVLPALEQAA